MIREDLKEKALVYYFDLDCDGTVDLIGYDSGGDGVLDRYDLPQGPLRIAGLAKELTQSIQQLIIPYPQLRICR